MEPMPWHLHCINAWELLSTIIQKNCSSLPCKAALFPGQGLARVCSQFHFLVSNDQDGDKQNQKSGAKLRGIGSRRGEKGLQFERRANPWPGISTALLFRFVSILEAARWSQRGFRRLPSRQPVIDSKLGLARCLTTGIRRYDQEANLLSEVSDSVHAVRSDSNMPGEGVANPWPGRSEALHGPVPRAQHGGREGGREGEGGRRREGKKGNGGQRERGER